MITQRLGAVSGVEPFIWSYTINTEAKTAGAVRGAIPFHLYGTSVKIDVDWGDGQTSKLSAGSFTEYSSSAAIHTYATPGVYQITLAIYDKNSELYIMSDVRGMQPENGAPFTNVGIMQSTVVSIDSPLPYLAGVLRRNGTAISAAIKLTSEFRRLFFGYLYLVSVPYNLFENNTHIISLEGAFEDCGSLSAIPSGFLNYMPNLTSVSGCFSGVAITTIPNDLLYLCPNNINVSSLFRDCTNLLSVPEDLLINQTAITSLYAFLYRTNSLGTFSLNIYSPSITSVTAFCPQSNPSPNIRTIHVIPGSTTEATFNANASSYYLTIVPDIVV